MTIDVPCSGCGQKLQVGSEHAGKMARCPACGHITQVPSSGGENPAVTDSTEPLPSEKPANWYMQTPEGQEYGPAPRGDVERWVAEGRVTADCRLKSGEAGAWQSADSFFPALTPPAPTPVWTPPMTPVSTAVSYQPAAATSGAAPFALGNSPSYGSTRPASTYQVQHRGGLILLLGLLGIILEPCPGPIFAIAAWVMGSNDLREMDAGRMDKSGSDLTRAGMIMGMIISVLWILALLGFGGIIFLAALAGG